MSEASGASLYPIFLKLGGRRVLVIGAGEIAERKIEALVAAGAEVLVVAPLGTPTVRKLADERAIVWHERRFEPNDARGAWLIVAATGDAEVQRQAAAIAEEQRVFILAVDDIANATAYSGAIVRKPPFTIAISSSGETPALARLLREILEDVLPGQDWVEDAKRLRAEWIASATPPSRRFGELVRAFASRRESSKS